MFNACWILSGLAFAATLASLHYKDTFAYGPFLICAAVLFVGGCIVSSLSSLRRSVSSLHQDIESFWKINIRSRGDD